MFLMMGMALCVKICLIPVYFLKYCEKNFQTLVKNMLRSHAQELNLKSLTSAHYVFLCSAQASSSAIFNDNGYNAGIIKYIVYSRSSLSRPCVIRIINGFMVFCFVYIEIHSRHVLINIPCPCLFAQIL
jgi:hypothetical protein